jgi:3'-phosphoadenosine 5'-phosphosulfate sulfotransferase (PAPS reductase)/FAD synthetase
VRTVASAQAQAREEKRRSSKARLTVLSLGVQSTTLALMAARGEIEVPDAAIFADTQWEPRAVYEHLEWLMSPGVLPFPVYRVTAGSIRDDIKRRRTPTSERFAAVPWWIVNSDGTESLGSRQCTSEYKLTPIMHEVRRLLGKSNRDRIPAGMVRVMLGISMDEMIA